jgi:lysophospholipase L1-like esterase
MEWSTEQVSWLVKVFQPERSVESLPGGWAGLAEGTRASLLGLATEVYLQEHARLVTGAKEAARELLADPAVGSMVDRLPLRKGAKIVAFGDSHTSDPQSWAVILSELLQVRRPDDGVSVVIRAVGGEASTQGLVRMGQVVALEPDWILFFIGVADARAHGPNPGKTFVDPRETARNVAELQRRALSETKARCLWITPPPVLTDRSARHWAMARFGIRFSNADIGRVAEAIRKLEATLVDLFSVFGETPPPDLVTEDGLHFLLEGQKRITLEVLRSWSTLAPEAGSAR